MSLSMMNYNHFSVIRPVRDVFRFSHQAPRGIAACSWTLPKSPATKATGVYSRIFYDTFGDFFLMSFKIFMKGEGLGLEN